MDAVKEGKAWMAIVIPEKFTFHMLERLLLIAFQQNIPDNIINGSTIEIYEDLTGMLLKTSSLIYVNLHFIIDLQITYMLRNMTAVATEVKLFEIL